MPSSENNHCNDWNIPSKDQWVKSDSWQDKRHIKTEVVWFASASDAREKALLDMVQEVSSGTQTEVPKAVMIYHSPYPNRYYNPYRDSLVFSTAELSHLKADDLKAALWNMMLEKKHSKRDRAVNIGATAATVGGIAGSIVEGIVGHGAGAQLDAQLIGFGVPTIAITGAETYKEFTRTSRAIAVADAAGVEATKNALELDPKLKDHRTIASRVEREMEKREKAKGQDTDKSR